MSDDPRPPVTVPKRARVYEWSADGLAWEACTGRDVRLAVGDAAFVRLQSGAVALVLSVAGRGYRRRRTVETP